MVVQWPFVGRADETRWLQKLIVAGDQAAAVITGPAGVGKTRLASEALLAAEAMRVKVLQATATRAATQLPFGALAGLLPHHVEFPGRHPSRPDLLRRWASALLDQLGSARRLVLFVDDAHLLDDASAALLLHLVAAPEVFVLATTRAGEPAPDPVVALWKEGHAARIELGRLDTGDLDTLLASALGAPVDPVSRAELNRRAQGNVLFLRELVLGARERDVLVQDDGLWRLRGALPLTDRLIELVEARLALVDADERALLELVAFGEPLGGAELHTLSDPELAAALERRHLLRSNVDRRRLQIRLAHPLYGDVLRSQAPAVRQRQICRQLAEAVEATGARRRGDVLRVASWRLTGGEGGPGTLLNGARAAHSRGDLALAEQLARSAGDSEAGFDADLLAAELAGLQGRTAEASGELTELAARVTDDDQRGRVALARITNSVTWRGDDPLHIMDDARATITSAYWRDRLDAERLTMVNMAKGPRRAAALATELLSRVTGPALAAATIPASVSLTNTGQITAALEAAELGDAAHRDLPEPLAWQRWWHDVTRCHAYRHAGRFTEARSLADAGYEWALTSGSYEAQAVFALISGAGVADCGRPLTAGRLAREAVMRGRDLERPVLERLGLTLRAVAAAFRGDAAESTRALADLDALDLPDGLENVDLLIARAWSAAAAGNLGAARDQLRETAALGDLIGDLVGAAAAWHGLARLGHTAEAVGPLTALVDQVEGELAPARLAHVRALVAGDADELVAVSEEFAAMGGDLLAAEAAADAAVAYHRVGDARAVAAQRRRATELADRCEQPLTPALQQITTRARLTEAERDTALLAAHGFANREIADQLHLSVRTVENRLQRVYSKLGVRRRTDLPQALNGT